MSEKILVYHPKVFYRNFIYETLNKEGISVETVESIKLLLKNIDDIKPQAVIVDVDELGTKDLAFVEYLRKNFPNTAIIVLLSSDRREYAVRYLRMGAIDCLEKPLKKEELIASASKAIKIEKHKKEKSVASIDRLISLAESSEKISKLAHKKFAFKLRSPQRDLVQSVLDTISLLFNAEKVSISWLDMDKRKYYVVACAGICVDVTLMKPKAMGEGIIGYVADKKEAVLVKDINKDDRFPVSPYKKQYKGNSFLCGPIFIDDEVVAVVSVSDRKDGSVFTEEDLIIFKSFLTQLSFVFKTNQLIEELEKNSKRFEIYYDLSDYIINLVETSEILKNLLFSVSKHFTAKGSAIYLIDENREFIVKESSVGSKFRDKVDFYDHLGDFLSKIQSSLVNKDVTKLMEALFVEEKINDAITVPITLKNFPLGFLVITDFKLENIDDKMLKDISRLFSVAIKNDWLYKNLTKTVDELVETNKALSLLMEKYKKITKDKESSD
ncbi:MAG: GAF domain-containing protein [Proteobacteria bacterium]|nr:GAF domain-containing protein [Pseudomonadota bacterium]